MSQTPENSIHPQTRANFRAWLMEHHQQNDGVWLINYKKATGKSRMTYNEIVEEALCFGWVDSKPNKRDEERSMLWLAPRKQGSGWSKLNKERVEKLIAQDLMTPAGLEKVEASKQDGSWNALDAVEALEIPDDLETAFATYTSARQHFEAFPRSVKRSILEWIANAKRPATREKRVQETAKLAQDNIRANQWRQ